VGYIPASKLTLNNLNDKLILITDRNYNSIINSTKSPKNYNIYSFNIYTYEMLKKIGFVDIESNNKNNFLWTISNYPIDFKFIIPSNLVNKDIIFSLFFTPNQDFSPPCDRLEFGLPGEDGQINWTQQSIYEPNFFIPAEVTASGKLELFSRLTFAPGQKCQYTFDSLDLVPYTNSN
jgi:hypothetical protein